MTRRRKRAIRGRIKLLATCILRSLNGVSLRGCYTYYLGLKFTVAERYSGEIHRCPFLFFFFRIIDWSLNINSGSALVLVF
jgi:hypothetical protein